MLGTEIEQGDRPAAILYALAAGRTRYQEIEDAIKAEPSRTLDRLIRMRLVERLIPVTEDPARTKRTIYRIADQFLAFYLSVLSHYRGEIDRGLGRSILDAVMNDLDDHMGPGIVAVGPWWREGGQGQIDAVVLARHNRSTAPVLVGESKWAREVNAPAGHA